MRVWIDLANSPHALLFAPLSRELERRGASVLITARDNAQTLDLARPLWPDLAAIGAPSPRGRAAKAAAIAGRVAALARWARAREPSVALSHNSYAQVLAARALRVPAVTAMDYEHQPANHVAFRAASRILVPEVLPPHRLRRQGATSRKLEAYSGLKEEIYLGDFEPDEAVLGELEIDRTARPLLVVARTPPDRAAYHRRGNPLFLEALRVLGARGDTTVVLLARDPKQRHELRGLASASWRMPERAVDARSLIYAADLFLGAGGTMTREAALMGIPTYSVFGGPPAAVDAWLEEHGKLRRLQSTRQLNDVRPRTKPPNDLALLRERSVAVTNAFVRATLRLAEGRG